MSLSKDLSICAYKKNLTKTIVDKYIGVHETCHNLLKIPLVISSRSFVSINVGRKIFKSVYLNSDNDKLSMKSGPS